MNVQCLVTIDVTNNTHKICRDRQTLSWHSECISLFKQLDQSTKTSIRTEDGVIRCEIVDYHSSAVGNRVYGFSSVDDMMIFATGQVEELEDYFDSNHDAFGTDEYDLNGILLDRWLDIVMSD